MAEPINETPADRLAENNLTTADRLAQNNTTPAPANNNTAVKVMRQLEYYFGDVNLMLDDYLPNLIRKREGGWIPLSTMVTLKRLSKISTDRGFIATTVANSNSDLIEVNETRDAIRRKPSRAIPVRTVEAQKRIDERSVYVEGVPRNARMDDIIDFMERNYGPTDKITIVKSALQPADLMNPDQFLRAYVCFQNQADRQKIMDEGVTTFRESVLRKMTAEEFKARKRVQRKLSKIVYGVRDCQGTLIKISQLPPNASLRSVFYWLRARPNDWNIAYIKPLERIPNTVIVRMGDRFSARHALEKVSRRPNRQLIVCGLPVGCELVTGDFETKVLDALLRDKMLKAGFTRIKRKMRNIALYLEGNAGENEDEEIEIDAVVDREVLFVQGQEESNLTYRHGPLFGIGFVI